jgi:hypothetical protein
VQPDRVPWQFNCTTAAREKLENYYGTRDLDQTLGNHLAKYRARPAAWRRSVPAFGAMNTA